jgi:hypothetical protein
MEELDLIALGVGTLMEAVGMDSIRFLRYWLTFSRLP